MYPRFDDDVETQQDGTSRRRGRPRDAGLEARVLDAAVEEYAERGWAGLTMDGVARRAKVGKSTLYLRWPDKESLLAAAVEAIAQPIEPAETGSLRGDLEQMARQLRAWYADPRGWAVTRIWIDAAGSGTQVGHFVDVVNKHYRPAALAIADRAVERGELDPSAPRQLLINAIYGISFMYAAMRPWDEHEASPPREEDLLQMVVDFCMRGLGPWLLKGAAGS
jgi:AcrR family transcriptional regulator